MGLVRLFLSCNLCPHKSIELIDMNMMGFPKSTCFVVVDFKLSQSHTHTKTLDTVFFID